MCYLTVKFWLPSLGALQIENSEELDQGKYECVAVNSAGTRYSAPANLYVRGKIPFDPTSASVSALIAISCSLLFLSVSSVVIHTFIHFSPMAQYYVASPIIDV